MTSLIATMEQAPQQTKRSLPDADIKNVMLKADTEYTGELTEQAIKWFKEYLYFHEHEYNLRPHRKDIKCHFPFSLFTFVI